MRIVYANKKTKKLIENPQLLQRKVGAEVARAVYRRIADIEFAPDTDYFEYIENSQGCSSSLQVTEMDSVLSAWG